jgi:thiol-disulfide isomerase/thioredoxin
MRWMFIIVVAASLYSCDKKEKVTRVDYHFMPFYFGKIYLEKIPVNEETFSVIDSAEITYKTDHLSFTIPSQEEAVFQLRVAGQPLRIYFINDADQIIIRGSATDPKDYSFENVGTNPHLKDFIDKQKEIIDEITPIVEKARGTSSVREQQELMLHADSLKAIYEHNARTFADTTKSAGAFLFAYNGIDFDKDRKAFSRFITNAQKRFPASHNIQVLTKEALDYISIYEEELNIGDKMPELNLEDINGSELSASSAGGKYTFIDLWSTWCASCVNYIPVKKNAAKKFPANKLAIVSIAVDAEKDAWKQVVQQQGLPGRNFIDAKMWRGKAAKEWKFDSIPFNYLVGPDGRILAKAIKPDSVMYVLNKFVK